MMVICMVVTFSNLKDGREYMGDDREHRMSLVYLCARQEDCSYPMRNRKALKDF